MNAAVQLEAAPGAGMPAQPATSPGALGKNADLTSQIHAVLPPPATVTAWRLRSYAREALAKAKISKRMRFCGYRIERGGGGVGLYSRPDRAYGRVSGVCICGQSLACPVCAPRIAAFRAAEVADGFKRATAAGYEARLVTFTTPHTLGSGLGREIDCFASAWKQFQSGRKMVERNAHSLGNQVGRECTWGSRNGWHYHHHQLRFDEPSTFDADLTQAQWLSALDYVGRRWRGSELHAFDVGAVGDEAGARYVAKLATSTEAQGRAVGLELAAGALKGKNLATLLLAASIGDEHAEAVWVRGVGDILDRKVSSVRWSRGLRSRLGMVTEKTDEQVAKDEVLDTDIFLGALNPTQWRGVLKWRAEFALCVAANRGLEAVNSFLAGLELGQLNDEDPRALWAKERKARSSEFLES